MVKTETQINLAKKILFNFFLFLLCWGFLEFCSGLTLHFFSHPEKSLFHRGEWAIIPEESWIEYHPTLGWFHKKNQASKLKGRASDQEIVIHTNAEGLRGAKNYALQKSSDQFRVAFLGDSFTFGFGVQDQETFTHVLEQKLPRYEMMNWGVPGYGVDQILLLMEEKVFQFHPDLILLVIYPEDFQRSIRSFTDAGYGKPYFTLDLQSHLKLQQVPVPKDKYLFLNPYPEIIQKSNLHKMFATSYFYQLLSKIMMGIAKNFGMTDSDTSDEWQLGKALLKRMHQDCQNHKIPFAIALAPPYRWITGTTEPIESSLKRFTTKNSIPFLDFTSGIKNSHPPDASYIPQDLHWSPKGHEVVAKMLEPFIKKIRYEHP